MTKTCANCRAAHPPEMFRGLERMERLDLPLECKRCANRRRTLLRRSNRTKDRAVSRLFGRGSVERIA